MVYNINFNLLNKIKKKRAIKNMNRFTCSNTSFSELNLLKSISLNVIIFKIFEQLEFFNDDNG